MHTLGNRILLSRLPKGIPTHWVQDVVAAHTHITREHIGRDIVTAMTHVQPISRRVREEIQAVILGLFAGLEGAVKTSLLPELLPFRLDDLRLVRRPMRILRMRRLIYD